MRRLGRFLFLSALLCSSLACGQMSTNPQPDSTSVEVLCPGFKTVLPKDWQYVDHSALDTDNDGSKECVVLYRFDLLAGTGHKNEPIAGVVYRPDNKRPPCIIPYPLRSQAGGHLCEHNCELKMEDVLSRRNGKELVVRDHYGGRVTRASIFYWEQPGGEYGHYEPLGHFSGDNIEVSLDEVVVDLCMPHRAQLATRYTYSPRNQATYYVQDEGTGALMMFEKYQLVFWPGEPEDVTLSQYPERVVMSFYEHYTDEGNSQYFTDEGWKFMQESGIVECGCRLPNSDTETVRVHDIRCMQEWSSQEAGHPCEDYGCDRATVVANVTCGSGIEETEVLWNLVRNNGHWELDGVSANPAPPTSAGGSTQ